MSDTSILWTAIGAVAGVIGVIVAVIGVIVAVMGRDYLLHICTRLCRWCQCISVNDEDAQDGTESCNLHQQPMQGNNENAEDGPASSNTHLQPEQGNEGGETSILLLSKEQGNNEDVEDGPVSSNSHQQPRQGHNENAEDRPASSNTQQQPRQEISEMDFSQLLVDIADWYDQLGYINMLKVLYRDYVPNNQLDKAKKVMDLLTWLTGSGKLSSTNLTILYDTVKATDQSGFKSEIKNQLPRFQNIGEIVISKFTLRRQSILKLGTVLTQHDIERLDAVYNMPVLKKYKDSWSLIMDLEQKKTFDEGKDKFIKVLKENKMKLALDAFGVTNY